MVKQVFSIKVMPKQYFIFLFFIFGFSLFSQNKITISGTITDKLNGENLYGATVYLKDTNYGTTTNEYGFYSLTVPAKTYTLIISYLGYKTVEKKLNSTGNLKFNVELDDDSNQLEEVVIDANESKRTNLRSPQMSVTKLSTKTIKQIPTVMGEVDIIKSIQLLPGVTNAGEGASGFNVRGGAEDQNLILLDEAIIYNTSHLFGFFSVFNSDVIKDIKLYKGGIPAQFGGRASSVLDIRQKDGNSKDFKATGGIGLISSRLAVEGPIDKGKGSFVVAGRSSYAHLFLKLAGETNSANFYDLNFKTNYKFNDNNKLYLSGYFGQDNFSLEEAFTNSYGNFSTNLRWNHVFNEKLFSNLSLIYGRYNYNMLLSFRGIDWTSSIENYNLKYDFGYFINDKLRLNFGLSHIYYNFNPGDIKPYGDTSGVNERKLDDKFALESGAYASLEHKLSDKLSLMYGLRYSYFNRLGNQTLNLYENDLPVVYNSQLGIYERANPIGERAYKENENIASYGNLEPRFALSYKVNDKTSVKASYNKMAQYLHLISNTTSATPLDVWAPSGKYIKPQIANQYAVGYFRNISENMYSIETELYYKTVDNRVDYIDGANLIAQNTLETEILNGESCAYGLELLLRKNKGAFTGWIAYTLSRAEQRALGNNASGPGINNGDWYKTAYDRAHDFSFTGNYKLNKKWSFAGNFALQSGRPVTYPNGQFQYEGLSIPTYSDRNTDRLPAYHRLDLSATLTPKKNKNRRWQGEWIFSIYNVYNRSNAASISFDQNSETGLNEATRTSIYGIVPSVSYNFKF